VFCVETVETAVGRIVVDVLLVDGWLSGPARAAPRIFVQAAAAALRFKRPNHFERFVRPRAGAVNVARCVTEPKWNGCWRFWRRWRLWLRLSPRNHLPTTCR